MDGYRELCEAFLGIIIKSNFSIFSKFNELT